MITLEYLTPLLQSFGYHFHQDADFPVFWRKVQHGNYRDKMAFSLVIITIDQYTVTIEGINEMLVRRAYEAGVLEIQDLETFDALRDVVFDDTHDCKPKTFETIFFFFEKQLKILESTSPNSEEHEEAVENIRIMVDAANHAELD